MKLILTDDVMEVSPGVMLFTKERLTEIINFINESTGAYHTCANCGSKWEPAVLIDNPDDEVCAACGAKR